MAETKRSDEGENLSITAPACLSGFLSACLMININKKWNFWGNKKSSRCVLCVPIPTYVLYFTINLLIL